LPDAYTDDHQRIIEVISRQVSTILKNAAEFERTRKKAFRDQLTGLPNIEHLYQLTRAVATHDGTTEPFSILVLDVDNLAKVNDAFGKQAGDQILARVVRATRRSLRAADFLFRYRDDEFIVLLLQTDHDTCSAIARRVIEALQRESAGAAPFFSVTLASATTPHDAEAIDGLIDIAARRLGKAEDRVSTDAGSDLIH
jgi:diguanylate cyclase (GGDEF)-like protein